MRASYGTSSVPYFIRWGEVEKGLTYETIKRNLDRSERKWHLVGPLPYCRLGTIPTDVCEQGSMRRSHRAVCEPPLYLPGLLQLWHRAQEIPRGTMALLRVWMRTRQGYECRDQHPSAWKKPTIRKGCRSPRFLSAGYFTSHRIGSIMYL